MWSLGSADDKILVFLKYTMKLALHYSPPTVTVSIINLLMMLSGCSFSVCILLYRNIDVICSEHLLGYFHFKHNNEFTFYLFLDVASPQFWMKTLIAAIVVPKIKQIILRFENFLF